MKRMLACGLAVLLAMPMAAAQEETFTVPVTSDFEDAEYLPFFEDIAERLLGRLGKGMIAVNADHEPGSGRIAGYSLNSAGDVVVSVDVAARNVVTASDDQTVGGGLVLNRDGNTFYGLFTDGIEYLFVAWVDGDITQRLSGTLSTGSSGAAVKLELRQAAGGVEFFVDGQSRGQVSDSRVTGDQAGLAVFGTGSYTFDNFYFTTLDDK